MPFVGRRDVNRLMPHPLLFIYGMTLTCTNIVPFLLDTLYSLLYVSFITCFFLTMAAVLQPKHVAAVKPIFLSKLNFLWLRLAVGLSVQFLNT